MRTCSSPVTRFQSRTGPAFQPNYPASSACAPQLSVNSLPCHVLGSLQSLDTALLLQSLLRLDARYSASRACLSELISHTSCPKHCPTTVESCDLRPTCQNRTVRIISTTLRPRLTAGVISTLARSPFYYIQYRNQRPSERLSSQAHGVYPLTSKYGQPGNIVNPGLSLEASLSNGQVSFGFSSLVLSCEHIRYIFIGL